MKMQTMSVALVCALLGGALGYGIRDWRVAADEELIMRSVEAHALGSMEAASCEAYRDDDPRVGIWALGRVVVELEKRVSSGKETPESDRHSLQVDAMLAHARMSKLYGKIGDPRGEDHIRAALEYAKVAYPTETMDRVRLFEFLERVDANLGKSESNHAPLRTARGSAALGR